MAPKAQTKPQVKTNRPNPQQAPRKESDEAANASAKAEAGQGQKQAETQAQAQGREVLSQVSESETKDTSHLTEQELADLEGMALTAKLNESMQEVFMPTELSARVGVYREANRVENVPADSVITWATPDWADNGAHLNWLLTEGGHRPVHPREVTEHRDGRGMFIPGLFEDKGDRVVQNGATLCIAKKSFAQAHRQEVSNTSRQRTEAAKERFQAEGDELDANGARVERSSDKVDMSRYTPMRDA